MIGGHQERKQGLELSIERLDDESREHQSYISVDCCPYLYLGALYLTRFLARLFGNLGEPAGVYEHLDPHGSYLAKAPLDLSDWSIASRNLRQAADLITSTQVPARTGHTIRLLYSILLATMAESNAKVLELEFIRPCGRLETYSTARHHMGFYNNVGLTAYYTTSLPLKSSLENVVFAALHQIIAKHPNLSAVAVNEDKSYPEVHFVRLPEIDLRHCVEFHLRQTSLPTANETDSELDELLRKQHDRGFKGDVKSPYWRLLITSSPNTPSAFTASWMFHHALSDGSSATLFHRSFLAALNSVAEVGSVLSVVTTALTPILPPVEELHPMTLSWSYLLYSLAATLLPSQLLSLLAPDMWTGSTIDATTSVPAQTTTVAISPDATRAFAAKCRSEKTSVTAALCALLAAVLQRSVAAGKIVDIDIPISLRPFIHIGQDEMVNAVGNLSCAFPAPTPSSAPSDPQVLNWDQARLLKASLTREVAKKGADNPVALLRYVSDIHGFFTSKHGKKRESSAEVSSIGVWKGGDGDAGEGVWRLGRMVFSQCANRTGRPVDMCVVTGGDGGLVLSFNGGEGDGGKLVGDVAGAMREGVERVLEQYGESVSEP